MTFCVFSTLSPVHIPTAVGPDCCVARTDLRDVLLLCKGSQQRRQRRRLHEDGTDIMAPIKLLFALVQIVSKAVLLSSLYRHRWVQSCWHALQSTALFLSNTRTSSCNVCVECLGAYCKLNLASVCGVAPNQRCMQHSIGAWITSFVWP